ncbi:MAG: hypothetical protein DWQ35_05730 [Planctomycetota bacterium]|nr:MAG: hypothetical protein DWQ35_05730 [Planctomycetota bacterium]
MHDTWTNLATAALNGMLLAACPVLAVWAGLARRPRWPIRYLILLGGIALSDILASFPTTLIYFSQAAMALLAVFAIQVIVPWISGLLANEFASHRREPSIRTLVTYAEEGRAIVRERLVEPPEVADAPTSPLRRRAFQLAIRDGLWIIALAAASFALLRNASYPPHIYALLAFLGLAFFTTCLALAATAMVSKTVGIGWRMLAMFFYLLATLFVFLLTWELSEREASSLVFLVSFLAGCLLFALLSQFLRRWLEPPHVVE